MTRGRARVGAVAAALLLGVAACSSTDKPIPTKGDDETGKEAIEKYGCGGCHTIPGVRNADGLVGPPLVKFSKRSFIAGRLANTEENLARWVQNPQAVDPGNAMPDLNVTPEDAENIAAYLTTLQ